MATQVKATDSVKVSNVEKANVPGWNANVEADSFSTVLNPDGTVKTFRKKSDNSIGGIVCTSNSTKVLNLYFSVLSKLSAQDKQSFQTEIDGEKYYCFENVTFSISDNTIKLQQLEIA